MTLSSLKQACRNTLLCFCFLTATLPLYGYRSSLAQEQAQPDEGVSVSRLAPGELGGQAYKLVYRVQAAPGIYWRFKTDFDNDFLVSNKYIREHHFISRKGNQVITEDIYALDPEVSFTWQTTIDEDHLRLEFRLLNPEQARQRFHYGYIQLAPAPNGTTQVTQVVHFDFFGASLWAAYPWKGGMRDFLIYTARWEQEAFQQWRARTSNRN